MVKKLLIVSLLVTWLFTGLAWFEAKAAGPAQAAMSELACSDPLPVQATACADLVQHILDSTVQIKMHGWTEVDGRPVLTPGRTSHATIKDGRYLVTHNHFQYPLRATQQSGYVAISLYRVNGDPILEHAPLTALDVVAEEAGMLVLEFKADDGRGLFEALELPSARFASRQALALQPGMEVAQVLWNGRQTSVQWTTIEKVMEEGLPRLELRSTLGAGSSGGGVFWQGQHIGNNLSRTRVRNQQNQIIRHFSTAALNEMPAETAAAYRVALSQLIQPVPDQDDPYLGIFYPHYSRWWFDALHEVFAGGSPTDV
jgi:hypothetical protein